MTKKCGYHVYRGSMLSLLAERTNKREKNITKHGIIMNGKRRSGFVSKHITQYGGHISLLRGKLLRRVRARCPTIGPWNKVPAHCAQVESSSSVRAEGTTSRRNGKNTRNGRSEDSDVLRATKKHFGYPCGAENNRTSSPGGAIQGVVYHVPVDIHHHLQKVEGSGKMK